MMVRLLGHITYLIPTSLLYNYALPSSQLRIVVYSEAQSTRRRLRPVADLTAPRTSRHRRPDADSEAQSTRRRLHSVADLTCRRLRHNDATVS